MHNLQLKYVVWGAIRLWLDAITRQLYMWYVGAIRLDAITRQLYMSYCFVTIHKQILRVDITFKNMTNKNYLNFVLLNFHQLKFADSYTFSTLYNKPPHKLIKVGEEDWGYGL